MLEQRIQQHFFDSADLKYQAAETLARPLADASVAILGCITSGGKVLAAGLGASMVDAQRFVAAMVGPFERERPGLAALALSTDAVLMATLASEGSSLAGHETGFLATQVQVLGVPGDVLLLMTTQADAQALHLAIEAAHDKEMTVIVLGGREHSGLLAALQETDLSICVPHDRAARVREVHALALHCLLDAVDVQLLGEQEST